MAANVLHQVPWFAPTRDVFQSSKPKSFVGLKFSVSYNHKAQHIKICSRLTASRGGDAFHICSDFRERKLIACAQATDAPSESQEDTAEIDQEADGAETSEDSSNGTALQVANDQSETPPKQRRPKLNEVMGILHRRAIEAVDKKRPIPDIRVGYVLQLRVTVPRTRRRFALYKGVVISKQNSGIQTTIRLRRIIAGVGIEIVFPLYSPLITEVIILERRKVRRARLYYLRDKLPKFSTVK